MSGPTVEDISASIARRIFGNPFLIREAIDTHHKRPPAVVLGEGGRTVLGIRSIERIVCRLETIFAFGQNGLLMGKPWHFCKPPQQIHQIGIRKHRGIQLQQVTQVVNGRRNRLQKMGLALEVATEAIGSKHLKRSEEYKQREPFYKMALIGYFGILLKTLIIFKYQLTTELERIVGRSLPKEGSEIIIERSLAATLEIDEIRIPHGIKHHVACLEVAIEKALGRL